MKKKALLLFMAMCMAVTAPGFTVAGASAQAGDNKETETGKGSADTEKYSDVSVLTGEPIDPKLAAQRPIAVMYPIDKEAQPQYGLSNVDVFYEIIEEGSMSEDRQYPQHQGIFCLRGAGVGSHHHPLRRTDRLHKGHPYQERRR